METEETITPCGLRKRGGLNSTHAEPAKKERKPIIFEHTKTLGGTATNGKMLRLLHLLLRDQHLCGMDGA